MNYGFLRRDVIGVFLRQIKGHLIVELMPNLHFKVSNFWMQIQRVVFVPLLEKFTSIIVGMLDEEKRRLLDSG